MDHCTLDIIMLYVTSFILLCHIVYIEDNSEDCYEQGVSGESVIIPGDIFTRIFTLVAPHILISL